MGVASTSRLISYVQHLVNQPACKSANWTGFAIFTATLQVARLLPAERVPTADIPAIVNAFSQAITRQVTKKQILTISTVFNTLLLKILVSSLSCVDARSWPKLALLSI